MKISRRRLYGILTAVPLAAIAPLSSTGMLVRVLPIGKRIELTPIKLPPRFMDFEKVYREYDAMIARRIMEQNKSFMKPHTVKL